MVIASWFGITITVIMLVIVIRLFQKDGKK